MRLRSRLRGMRLERKMLDCNPFDLDRSASSRPNAGKDGNDFPDVWTGVTQVLFWTKTCTFGTNLLCT
jgi:hypothetical protein